MAVIRGEAAGARGGGGVHDCTIEASGAVLRACGERSDVRTLLLPIVVDTREQRPFSFRGRPAFVTVGTLEAGDYSLAGFERRIAIERKSLQDLVGVLGRDRERFVRELARLRGYDCAAVVVEEPEIMLRTGRYRGGLNPAAAWQSVIALSARFRVPFFFCKDREDAEGVTFDILRHYARERWRELQAFRPGTVKQTKTMKKGE